MSVKLGFCNLKGGVGKTTACQNVAVALAKAGRKVAVIDMDPQSNLSAGFGVTPAPTEPQVFDLLTNEAHWDDIVKHKEGVDIIPSSLNLVMAELNQTGIFERDSLLREALEQIPSDRYDYIIIDSPPQLGIFTRNVLAACDKIIVPMDGGFYSLFGLKLLENSLSILRERLGNNLEILGILMTNYNPRLYIAHSIFEEVKKSFGNILFESYISQSVSLIEATSMGLSIFEYSPKSKAAQCYKEVAEELIKRIEGKEEKVELPKKKTGRPKKSGAKASVSKAKESKTKVKTDKADKVEATPEIQELKEIKELEPEELEMKIEEVPAPVFIPESKPAPVPEPEPEPEVDEPEKLFFEEVSLPLVEIDSEPEQELESETESEPEKISYEQNVKQDLIDLLPERQKNIWTQILAPINDVSRGEIDIQKLREDFLNSDKYRYTFYILSDDDNKLNAVSFPDQISEPLKCVVKIDENGSAEIFF